MKTSLETELTDELRPEYKLSELKNRVRGKYADRFPRPFATLDPDIRAAFPTDEAVNAALRTLIQSGAVTVTPEAEPVAG